MATHNWLNYDTCKFYLTISEIETAHEKIMSINLLNLSCKINRITSQRISGQVFQFLASVFN